MATTQGHKWTAVLTDIQGSILGELTNADSRKVVLPLSRNPTASCVIQTTHKLAHYFFDPTWDGMLKMYRDGTLVFCGPIVSSDDQPANDSLNVGKQAIAITAAGPLWRFGYRLLGNTSTGWSLGDASTPYDLGFIAGQMLAYGNSEGYTGLDVGTLTASSTGAAGPYYMAPIDAALVGLSTAVNSFEFTITPREPTNVSLVLPSIGTFSCGPLVGSLRANAIFEHGGGRANIASYGHTIDRSGLCNQAYINQPAATDHSGILEYHDSASITARGVYQAIIPDNGVQYDSLRNALIQKNVQVRTNARRILNITLVPNALPNPLVDYIVGDQIRARIALNSGYILDVNLRVWGITFDIDKLGNETVSLQLVAP